MNNWSKVDKIRTRYKECSDEFKEMDPEDFDDTEQEFIVANLDRGILLNILDQLRPRLFDPDDRETWPEINKKVIAWRDNGLHKIVHLEETERIKWVETYANNDECVYRAEHFNKWQYLPEVP